MYEEILEIIDMFMNMKPKKTKEGYLLVRDKNYKLVWEPKSYGGILWIYRTNSDDKINNMAMVIIENGKVKFVSNEKLVEEVIYYYYTWKKR